MPQAYSDPRRASDPYALPDVEVFYQSKPSPEWGDLDEYFAGPGWYYWYCFPGCLPDSDPVGPFETAEAAEQAAQEDAGAFDEED